MPWIDAMWVQRGLDALHATLDVDTATKRDMIEFLFDEGFWDRERLSWEGAQARFNACLNPNKTEFFKLGEIWALSKRFRRCALVRAMADDLGFALRPVPTDERRHELLARLLDAQERLSLLLAETAGELKRLDAPEPPARVAPAVRTGEARRFRLPPGGDDDEAQHAPGGF